MQRNAPFDATLVEVFYSYIAEHLGARWTVSFQNDVNGVDSVAELSGPEGRVKLALELKGGWRGSAMDLVPRLRDQQRRIGMPVVLGVDYVGPALRAACRDAGIGFFDRTGWTDVRTESPTLVWIAKGASKDPHPLGQGVITKLTGVGATRVVEALIDNNRPVGIRDFAGMADVAPSTVSRVLPGLESENIVERDARGAILSVAKRRLLELWLTDYSFTASNTVRGFAPLGTLERTARRMSGVPGLALTGVLAQQSYLPPRVASVLPTTRIAAYCQSHERAVSALDLVPFDDLDAATVLIAVPKDPRTISSATPTSDGAAAVSVARTLADLFTMGGRGPQAAEQLVSALAVEDSGWRVQP